MLNATIRLHGVAPESIVDGPGLRYAIFTQGCVHNCQGCHNPGSHDIEAGYNKSVQKIFDDIVQNPLLSGVTFSGGEPFLQTSALCELAHALKKNSSLSITTYTGYTLETLEYMAQKNASVGQLLQLTDMLVDGPFIQELCHEDLRFCGSSNQRIWCKTQGQWQLSDDTVMWRYTHKKIA